MAGLIALLYALTGLTSLVYQLVWSRYLALALGGAALATSATVATFLAGLALGAWLLGTRAERSRRPLLVYGLLELLIAAWAWSSPMLAAWLREASAGLDGPAGALAGSLALLFLPTVLMGGTFPFALAAAEAAASRPLTARLYGANTAGATLGVLLAAFAALPLLGLGATLRAAALLNLAIALLLIGLGVRPLPSHPSVPPAAARDPARAPASSPRLLLLALFLSGFGALLGELAWTRALSLVVGSSVYAFAIVLAAFLVGIALGSLRYGRRSPTGDPALDMAHYETRAAFAAALFAVLLTVAPLLLLAVLRRSGGHIEPLLGGVFVVAFLATAYATTALGAAFPAGLEALRAGRGSAAVAGRGYAVNTLGAVLGALLTALLLIPRIGLSWTLALGVVANLWAAACAGGLAARPRRIALLGTLAALALLPLWWRFWQERGVLLSGVYAYAHLYSGASPAPAPAAAIAAPIARPALDARPGVRYVADGTHANVAVIEDAQGIRSLLIDGKADASSALDGDMRTQLLLGHLPALLHPGSPRQALVVGAGSAVTASALLAYPELRLELVEIEPRVIEAARLWFAPANRAVLDDPRTRIVIADGRRLVGRNANRYDILTSEPSNLWMSGTSSLFTAEFFSEAARALRPDGVLCQWMHLYQVSPDDVRTLLRGVLMSFPHLEAFLDGPDLLLVAGRAPLRRLDALEPPAEAVADLARVGIDPRHQIALFHVAGRPALARFAGRGRLHSDDHPTLEFSAPRSLAVDRSAEIALALRAAGSRP